MKTAAPKLEVGLPDLEGAVFDKPWQAQAFSLVVNMHKSGLFKWKDWAEMFSAEVSRAPARPGESVNDTYYRQWVATLERMVVKLRVASSSDVTELSQKWKSAYLNTPHGHPIELSHSECSHENEHEAHHAHHTHEPKRSPVLVVPAAI